MLAPLAMYARLGWRLFPCAPGQKRPCIKEYHSLASTNMAQIKQWLDVFATTNWAVSCGKLSGVVVIDLDGKDAWGKLAGLEKAFGALPRDAGLQITPSGNAHLFFKWPDGFEVIPSTQTRLVKGIELKSDLSATMLAPSVIHDSPYQFYAWAEGWDDIEQAYQRLASIPQLPAWVALLAQTPVVNPVNPPPADAARVTKWLARFVGSQKEGNRNNALYWAALRAAEHGVDQKEAVAVLALAAEAAGLNSREAVQTVNSAYRRLAR